MRLGHPNHKVLRKICKILNLTFTKFICEVCAQGKNYHGVVQSPRTQYATSILFRMHKDTSGPFKPSFNGLRYALTILDECSRKAFGAAMKNKSNAPSDVVAKF